jgi:hypothetical protein
MGSCKGLLVGTADGLAVNSGDRPLTVGVAVGRAIGSVNGTVVEGEFVRVGTSGEEVGALKGMGEGLMQFGGCIGTQMAVVVSGVVKLVELVLLLTCLHSAPGSQQSELALHGDE